MQNKSEFGGDFAKFINGLAGTVAGVIATTQIAGPLVAQETVQESSVYEQLDLFGDIFERDNLDWQSRELATVGMLSALPGAEPQLQAHMRVSMNVGLTVGQLRQLTQVLGERVDPEHARRAREALAKHLATLRGG